MKRSRETSSNVPLLSDNGDTSAKRPPAKRAKASQACTSCRKHKTRCELLESASYYSRCHRCEVLSITCSFETNAPIQARENSPVTTVRRRILNAVLSTPQSDSDNCLEPTRGEIAGSTSRPPMSPWEFLKVPGIPDWTATPMLAMLTLSKMACKDQTIIQPTTNFALNEVLSSEQMQYLLGLFESRYAPWLSLPPKALGEDPVLNLVRCTVASRHLEPSIHARVFPSLRKLTEEAIMKHIFNPTPSPAIIQAFALLALWSPFGAYSPSSSETHDSRLIAAAAINMCSSLRFDQAATDEQVLNERRNLGAELTPQESAFLATAEQKKVLWMCVHNVESIVCIGTGRGVSSKATACRLWSLTPLKFSTLEDARRTRILLTAMIFDLTETGLRLEISEDHNKFEKFCDESAEKLWRFDGIQRIITSVHVVTDFEVFYAHILVVKFYFCRLTFLIHTLRHIRMHIPPSVVACAGNMMLTPKVTHTGCGFALSCARDALASTEALLTTVLSIKDTELLATAPDSVFAMISFAAAHLTTSRFLIIQSRALRYLPSVGEELLARTVKLLQRVSLSVNDNASRCARVISGFLEYWDERPDVHDPEATNESPVEPTRNQSTRSVPSLSSASKTTPHEYSNSESTTVGPSAETTAPVGGLDYMFDLDQDTLLHPDFWQYLTEIPTMQPDINAACDYAQP